jgi:tetratricopeptide (TPR) repeat protein
MEENRLLVSGLEALVLAIVAVTIASCALPRIAILRDPLTPEERVNLGVSYETRGELDAALKEYKAASNRLPLAYLYTGNVYFQQNNLPQAEKSYRQAIKKTQTAQAYNNLAWLYYTTDTRLEVAEQLAGKAVDLSPDSEDFKDTLRKIQEKRGR